ncbi:MAG: hypothetical protein E6657_06995, partial [Acinetobacter sp.]|nr:hypothetical protein [Acinetobacter sp.]
GGHLRVCWFCTQSANPPSFCHHLLAEIGRILICTGIRHMRTILSLSLATFAKVFTSIPNWSLKRFNRL